MGRRPGRVEQVAALVASALIVWQALPEHQRTLIRMRVAAGLRRAVDRWARSEGQAGMADELSDRPGYADRHYGFALHLSVLRDRLGRVLEDMRP